MSEEARKQVEELESTDPQLFEELSLKKKWTNVSKNPDKAIKDQDLNKASYWYMINHLPEKGVKSIVNDKILQYDKVTCDRILRKILDEK